jgi:diguanylate cyclase (GGDEF)-like protein
MSDQEFFQVLRRDPARAPFISLPTQDPAKGAWAILLSRALTSAQGRLLGFVSVSIDLTLFEQLYSRISEHQQSSASLFRRDGVLLARFPRMDEAIGTTFGSNADFAGLLAATDHAVVRRPSMIDGLNRLIAPRGLTHFPLIISVTRTMSAVLAIWWRQVLWLGGATGVTELVLGILVVLGLRRLRDQETLSSAYAAAVEARAGQALAESELALAREREQRTQEVRRQALRFDTAADNMLQGLLMVDGSGHVLVANRRFKELFGLPETIDIANLDLEGVVQQIIAAGSITGDEFADVQAWRADAVGRREVARYVWELSNGRVLMVTHQPTEEGWLATYEDATERRQADARMAYLAQHDTLTDLPNRLLFREQLTQALAYIRRGRILALLFLDLDQFKGVNDTLGHPVGDALLQAVAQRLRERVRETDIVARLGGDEFAIVQIGLDDPTEASDFAERLISVLEAPFTIEGHQIIIGTSIGVAFAPQDGMDPDTLLKNADLALYRAKQDGRGVCRMYQTDMDAAMQVRRTLELDLRLAQRAGQLELHFQPLVDLQARAVGGFEALLRWRHPERGLVSPAAFIPLAEEIGVIVPMGEWVLRLACAIATTWPGSLKVAVNLSPVQFKSRNLVAAVAGALRDSGLAPARLELEITETAMLQDTNATLETLHALRALGVSIALDDFGTGYSSLSYLRRFPFDRIKIDQSFVRELGGPRDCSAIVRAVVQLSHELGMATTAEGVETVDQLRMLAAAGCTDIQGYLFSPPVPGPAVRELLRTLPSLDDLLPSNADPLPVDACLAAE